MMEVMVLVFIWGLFMESAMRLAMRLVMRLVMGSVNFSHHPNKMSQGSEFKSVS